MRHFTDAQVERSLANADLGAVLREAFVDLAHSRAAQQPRMRTDAGGVKLSTLGAVLPGAGVAGAKVYTTIAGEFSFLIALFSARSGKPLATFEAGAITRRRTAAVSVLAAQLAAVESAATIAVFGTGVQARSHLEAFARAYPNAALRVVGRRNAEVFAADAARMLGREVRPCETHAALAGAQIVVTATRSTMPLFEGGAVAPGAFVAAVGSSRPDAREVDDALLARTQAVLVEWKEQALREAGDLVLAAPAVRSRMNIVELGEAFAGHVRVRASDADIVVFKSVGVGIEDVAVAGLAYRLLTGSEP